MGLLPMNPDILPPSDEQERAISRSRRKFQTDMQSNYATMLDRGRQERSIEIARRLLKRGRPIEEIMEDTDLTREEITLLCEET